MGRNTVVIFAGAFFIRFISTIATTKTSFNPESQADAIAFGQSAQFIAAGIRRGVLIFPDASATHHYWGLFLAPFWLIPGPSAFYGRVGNALLGALAIYNVYLIARHYHSHRAGVVAAAPMIVYPSFIAVQSTLLREALILFCITFAVRLFLIPLPGARQAISYGLALVFIFIADLHRPVNTGIYIVALVAGLLTVAYDTGYLSRRTLGVGIILSVPAVLLAIPFIREGVDYLARTRNLRASGRTVYLPKVVPETIPQLLAFSWIGAAYFLYAPFPWMISTIPDLIVGIEGLVNLGYTLAAIGGVRWMYQRDRIATNALVLGFLIAIVLYGVGTVNFGTGMRHRQMFLWVVFLFGGIYLAERFRVNV